MVKILFNYLIGSKDPTNRKMINISYEQALVLLSGVFVYFINAFIAFGLVGRARAKYKIPYPNLYEPMDSEGKLKTPFNNYQRGHMNMVENMALFFFLLFASSLFHPLYAAYCGFTWGFGRLVYALAYAIDPKYRVIGEFFMLAEFFMVYLICKGCYQIITLNQ